MDFKLLFAILGIIFTTAIVFVSTLFMANVTNYVSDEMDNVIQPIVKDNPQAQTVLETSKTVDIVDDLSNDAKNIQKTSMKGVKGIYVFPIMVLVAGGLAIMAKLGYSIR